jgi:ubiquinone/menaquinone biosynthesis C-methylase UbiE
MGSILKAVQNLQRRFRAGRMRDFLEELPAGQVRILDVGGTPDIWVTAPARARIFLLNMPRARAEAFAPHLIYVEADGCRLPFADQSFDIVFSNSVIEHVGSEEAQERFAREVARVGKGYWVQTPNRYFPVETHLLTPFIHFLPKRLAAFLAERLTVWALIYRPGRPEKRWYLNHILREVRLCSKEDFQRLFPGATIRKERFCFFTKSLIAVKHA